MGKEGIDFVTCKICGYSVNCRISNHLRFCHKIGSKDYLKMFPGSFISSKNYTTEVAKRTEKQFSDPKQRKSLSDKRTTWSQSPENKKILSRNAKECQNRPDMIENNSKKAIKRLQDPTDNFSRHRSRRVLYNGINGIISMASSWEFNFSVLLDKLGIKWEYNKYCFRYFFCGSFHRYLVDFYLPDLDVFVELHPYRLLDSQMFAKIDSIPIEHDAFILDEYNWDDILFEIRDRSNKLENVA